ncbi:GldG family protein [Mediterraneibacter glycyrrhizinilyticus]|uniref:GldG family protein n=1 Tax=Mediterraneibacter glycyrrhizinilyticus TaxID=342942 RepID=UPI0025A413F7|nr:GldG family protein [Mediterraneibacter glycyrrhizinilyticus]MDM8210422.1 GldG family protein [Mediterraneibacter glycyrrhizinilyticus]
MKSLKNIFRTSGTKHGAYSVGLTVLVIAVVIVFNLVVGQIPEAYRNLDVSSTKIYDISDTTTELLDSLDNEVDMKVLAVKDDTDERITTFLSRYASLSDKINVEWIDPVLHPSALTDYDTTENTIVISCEDTGKTTTVSFNDILVMDQYSYYYYGTTSYTEFDGEGQLTGAVNYVTNEADHTIYQTTGHGESTLSTTITDLMEKNSYTLSEVNLLMSTSIPEDCDLLLMYAPTTDLSEDEAQMLRDYLAGGGKVMILFGDTSSADLPSLAGVLSEYGIEAADGYIADPTRCYQGNYYYIFPELSVSGDLADNISSEMVLLTNAHGMNLTDPEQDTISTTLFMSSSDQAYAVTEETQEQGSYTLGAVATETIESADEESTESRLTVISAGSLIDQSITDTFPQLENTQIFMNAVTANFEGVQNLSIEAKSLGTEYNTMQHTGLLSFLVIFGIPAVILIGGFVVWFRRRRA